MELCAQSAVIRAPQELCFEVVAAAGRRLEKRSKNEWVVEFTTRVGDRTVTTVELLILDRPTSIDYRWLEGPLPEVEETISFSALDAATTRLDYRGTFRLGRGLLGWLIGVVRVKPLFDRLVAEHLEQAKEVAEARAARSQVHATKRRGT